MEGKILNGRYRIDYRVGSGGMAEDDGGFLNALLANLTIGKNATQGGNLLVVSAAELDDGLKTGDSVSRKSLFGQFGVDVFKPYLVELVDSDGDVNQLVGLADDLGDAGKDFAVVDVYGDAYAEIGKDTTGHLHEVNLAEQRVGAYDVGIALVELAVASPLRTVGTPYGLHLIATEGQGELVAVHNDIAGEGDGEVVP